MSDSHTLTATPHCDQCGSEVPMEKSQLFEGAVVTCPRCGTKHTLDAAALRGLLDAIERAGVSVDGRWP